MSGRTMHVDESSFDREVLESDVPVLVDFWAEWCPPCRMLGPIVDQVATEVGQRARVVKIDVDSSPNLARRYGIQSIPTTIVFRSGQPVNRGVGVEPKERLIARLDAA